MMLQARLRGGLITTSSSAVLRSTRRLQYARASVYSQSRFFWNWRRGCDWSSQLDPSYQHSHHVRSLKTRAKLRAVLRRRGKFEWDILQKPFFTPKHIRWASHWNGKTQWEQWVSDEDKQAAHKDTTRSAQEQDFDLSQKEKKWKELVGNMRRRISRDPYEAVFGKRFEPFWSPLVPSWMREDVNDHLIDRSSQESNRHVSTSGPQASQKPKRPDVEPIEHGRSKPSISQPKQAKAESPEATYAYSSSTSWDSRTNRTRKTKWDSVSNNTRRYEYDPITNRMVQVKVETPEVENISSNKSLPESIPVSAKTSSPVPLTSRNGSNSTATRSRPAALAHLPKSDLDLLTADRVRASMGKLKDSTSATQPVKKAALEDDFDAKAQAADHETDQILAARASLKLKSSDFLKRFVALDPSSNITHSPEMDKPISKIDYPPKPDERVTHDVWDRAEIALTPGQYAVPPLNDAASAAQNASLKQELENMYSLRSKLLAQKAAMETSTSTSQAEGIALQDAIVNITDDIAQKKLEWVDCGLVSPYAKPLQTTLDRTRPIGTSSAAKTLQPVLSRFESRREPATLEDADDSAAHESTEISPPQIAGSIPRKWSQQADLLQSDRVTRTSGKKAFPVLPRWIEDMNARKAAHQANQIPTTTDEAGTSTKQKLDALLEGEINEQKLRFSTHEARNAHESHGQELEKELDKFSEPSKLVSSSPQTKSTGHSPNRAVTDVDKALDRFESGLDGSRSLDRLEIELAAQKAEAKNGEERYKKKVKTLQAELEMAYKQSSQHSEMHLEHIRKLEKELKRFEGSAEGKRADSRLITEMADQKAELENRYKGKLRGLQTELETAYKQSSKHSEMHMDQIRQLEQELEKFNLTKKTKSYTADDHPLKAMQGEGDFCTNVTKYADSNKWYKRPAAATQQTQVMDKAEQKLRDERLVKEVRNIYEQAYGAIHAQHMQNKLMKSLASDSPVKSNEDASGMAGALSPYEQKVPYGFKDDGLANDLHQQETKGLAVQQSGSKSGKLADKIAREEQMAYKDIAAKEAAALAMEQTKVAESRVKAESQTAQSAPTTVDQALEWRHPPVYKVLAYDSGNDKFSTATTTSNFTTSEQPISIPQALSQLYQPARFVQHFAKLQSDGFQVIYGTRDLLVFKQVKPRSTADHTPQRTEHLNIHDHGSLRPYENTLAQEAAMFHDSAKPKPLTSDDPSSVEHGHVFGLTPPENAVAQEAANHHDLARKTAVNPIDGMIAQRGVKPATGNFASPTGFVNLDPVIFHPEAASEPAGHESEVVEYPRVRRQEPVFSATLPPPPVPTFGRASTSASTHSRLSNKERKRQYREEVLEWRRDRQRERRTGAGAIKWALSVGVLAAGTAYVIGSIADNSRARAGRGDVRGESKERWQEILEGKRSRWE